MENTWATPADVRSRWVATEDLPADSIIQAWLNDAETLILAEYPHIAEKMAHDPGGEWLRRVTLVEVQLVSQVLKNPDGVRQKSNTAGVFTEQTTFGTETLSAGLYLTPMHRAILTGGAKRHAGIDMTPATAQSHPLESAWVNGPEHLAPKGHL